MRRSLIVYLFLASVAEAVILLLFHGTAIQYLKLWKFNDPERALPRITEWAPMVPRFGLIIPVALLALAAVYTVGKVKETKPAIHALGLSIVTCAALSCWTMYAMTLPGIVIISGMEGSVEDAAFGE